MSFRKVLPFLAVGILLLGGTSAWAQVPTGSIAGTILDPTGAAIPGAQVTVTNQGTGAVYRVSTSEVGAFSVPSLPIGFYRVEASAQGFKTAMVSGIKVDAGKQYSVPPINLELGAVTETVTVEAGAELVRTTDASVTGTVELKQISQLPLLDRSPLALLDLQAGVNNNVRTTRSINGMRQSFSNVTVDGVNVQDNFIRQNTLNFLPNLLLINQVAEFTIVNQNAGSNFGYGASQVAFATPSGTNAWHGDVFWYHRNNKVAANDWFANASGTDKPKLIQNQGGFGVGGPVVPDKVFVYGYYELLRLRQEQTDVQTVLTPSARQGIFSYVDTATSQIRQVDVLAVQGVSADPFVANLLNRVPTTINDFSVGDSTAGQLLNTAGFRFNQRSNRTRDNYGIRADWIPSVHHAVSGTWQWNRDIVDRPDIDQTFNAVPVVFNDDTTKFFSGSHRWSPSGTFTNEFRGGFNLAPALFVTNEQFGSFVIGDLDADGGTFLFTDPVEDFRPQGRFTDTWNVQDNATLIRGNHTLSFGGSFQRVSVDPNFSSFAIPPNFDIGLSSGNPFTIPVGDPNFPNATGGDIAIANELLASLGGFVDAGQSEFNVTSRTSGFVPGAINRRSYDQDNLGFYFSDSWRIRPNFTLNYGLRWEYFNVFDERNGLFLTPVLPTETRAAAEAILLDPNPTIDFAGDSAGRPPYDKDLNNFGPQIGIAWDVRGDGRTAIRAGYSISYVDDAFFTSGINSTQMEGLNATVDLGGLTNTLSGGLPSFPTPTFQVPRTLADNIADFGVFGPGTPATIFTIDPELATPYVQQWNLAVQQDIGWDTAVEVKYLGNRGVKLVRAIDFNQVIIRENGFLDDFLRARNNGFICEAAGMGFDPFCALPGSQTLTFFPTLPFNGLIGAFGGFFDNMIRSGEPAEYVNFLNWFGPLFTGSIPFGGVNWTPNPSASVSDFLLNWSTSDYHAGVIEVRRRPARGVYFQANYTFSKILTDSSGCRGLNSRNGGCNAGQNRFDPLLDFARPDLERARAEYDITHAFKANFVFDLPMGSGQSISSSSATVNKLIGGWSLGSIVTWQSGSPFSIFSDRGTLNRRGRSLNRNTALTLADQGAVEDLLGLNFRSDGVFFVSDAAINAANSGRAVSDDAFACQPFGPALLCNPEPGTVGNLARNAFDGPTFFNWDFSVVKKTDVTETVGIEFRTEVFNLFNNPTFFVPDFEINDTSFGRISSTVSGRRIIQFGLRVTF